MSFTVGTDVGGTFTDLWARADDGRRTVVKLASPADIISGIEDAVVMAAEHVGLPVGEFCAGIERFGHRTTAGLNALLTGPTPRTGLLTTDGFGDTLEIGCRKRQVAGLTTTAAKAALGPVLSAYLADLDQRLHALGLRHPVMVMTGAGGVVTAAAARPACAAAGRGAHRRARQGRAGRPLGPGLRLRHDDGEWQVRSRAGAVLARGSTGWRAGARRRHLDPRSLGLTLHAELTLTEWVCPLSGESLAVVVHRVDEAPIEDLLLDLAALPDAPATEASPSTTRAGGVWSD